jgi:hypothetical protein
VHQKRGDKTPLRWLFIVKKKIAIKRFAFFCLREESKLTHAPKPNPGTMMAPLKRIAAASKHLHFYF